MGYEDGKISTRIILETKHITLIFIVNCYMGLNIPILGYEMYIGVRHQNARAKWSKKVNLHKKKI